MTDKSPTTITDVNKRVTKNVGLYVLISLVIAGILFAIDPFFFFLTPFVSGAIALVFATKMIIVSLKWSGNNNRFQKAYIIGAVIIIAIEVVVIAYVVHVAGNIRWM